MKIDEIVSRFDEDTLQQILGGEVIGTLKTLGTNYIYSESLLKVLSNTYSNEELLLNRTSRNALIDVLSPEEISRLATLLNLPKTEATLYDSLKAISLKGEALELFFQFFEEEISREESIEWISEKSIVANYQLFDYQRRVLDRVSSYLSSEKNRVLIHMPTGSGKTRTAISFVCRFLVERGNTNVVWFANTKELLDQAYSEFVKAWSFLGDREIKAYKFWDRSEVKLSEVKGSFIVAGLDKAYQALMRDVGSMSAFANSCSLVILDEAHMAIAPTYQLIIENITLNKAALIGLSATPGRTWNDPEEDKKLADFFFFQKAKLEIDGHENPVDYLIENGYLAKVKTTKLLSNSGVKLTQSDFDYLSTHYVLPMTILKEISENRLRNMAIISKIKQLIKVHKRIILFAITKDHAIVLNSLLTALGINSKVLTSSTHFNERTKIIETFKESKLVCPEPIVLCNYGILTTGFDAPETSCAVIARPTDSLVLYSQMVGRAIRGVRSGGNAEAEIVTVIDEDLPGFNEVAEAFLNWEDVWEK